MTSQMCDFFEYDGTEFCLMGFTGGNLPSAEDFGMHFSPGSTADARGHCMVYGIDTAKMLVVKRIEVRGEEIEPISHQYKHTMIDQQTYYNNLNRIIPLTGCMLFSTLWVFAHLLVEPSEARLDQKYPLFEAVVDQGHIKSVTEISSQVRKNVLGHNRSELGSLWQGDTTVEKIANVERIWDFTASILSRRYDALYMHIWYFNFPEYIEELKRRVS